MTWFTFVLNSIDAKNFVFASCSDWHQFQWQRKLNPERQGNELRFERAAYSDEEQSFFARFDILIRKCTRWPLLLVGRRYAQKLFVMMWNSKADKRNCIRSLKIRVHLVCDQNMIRKSSPNATWYQSASVLRPETREKNPLVSPLCALHELWISKTKATNLNKMSQVYWFNSDNL